MIHLLIALIVIGAVLYIVSLLPIDSTIKRIVQVIAFVFIAIYLIREFLPAAGLS